MNKIYTVRMGLFLVLLMSSMGTADAAWVQCRTEGGETTIPTSASSANVTLGTAITDTSQAFLLVDSSGASGVTGGAYHMVSGYIANTTTLTFQRGAATTTAVYVTYTLVECFDNEFSVQRGETAIASGASSNTATITSVDTTKSMVIVSSRSSDTTANEQTSLVTGELQNATTILVKRQSAPTITATVRWEAVTFSSDSGASVQTSEVTLPSGSASVTDTISSVNTDRSWLYCSWDANINGLQQTTIGCELTNSTTVTFYRYASQTYTNRIRYYVVEFPAGMVTVQRGSASNSGSATDDVRYDHDITITAVNTTTKAFPFVTNTVSGTGTAFPRNKWIEQLTSTTNLRTSFWRGSGATTDDNTKYWQVIEFLLASPNITSWGNTKTSDASLSITVNVSEVVKFNATANQIGLMTWRKDGAVDQTNSSVSSSSYTTSWATEGSKEVRVNISNANGTSANVTWAVTVQTTTTQLVLGYAECETEQSTTNTSLVDACTLTFNADAGDYIIAVAFELGQSDTTNTYYSKAALLIDGTENGNVTFFECVNATDRHNMGWIKSVIFTAASHTIKVQYATNNTLGTAYIRGIHIFAWKAPTFQYKNADAEQSFGTTETTLATLTFTPPSAQDYLILTSHENRGDYDYRDYMRTRVDGIIKNQIEWDSPSKSLNEYHGYATILVQNLTAASHTINVTGQTPSGTRTARNVRIAAIPLGSLTKYNSSNETVTGTTSTAYIDKLSYSPTISTTGDHVIFASSVLNNTDTTYTVNPFKYNNLVINTFQYQEAKDIATNAYVNFFAVKRLSLNSGSNTFKIQHKTSSSTYPVYTKNARIVVIQIADTTPPASITNLANTTGIIWINWTWTNPSDADFNYTMVYIDGTWQQNTSNPFYNLTGLGAGAARTISTHTVDTSGNINQTWVNQTTTTQLVLGYAECETEQSTTNTTLTDACTLTFNADAGDYIIAVAYELGSNAVGYNVKAGLFIDGTQYGGDINFYPSRSATERHGMGWVKKMTFTAGNHTINVRYAAGVGTAYIRGIHVLAWKAPAFQSAEANASQNFGTTETTLATLTFTPASAQDYLILASFENQGSWSTLYMRLKVDGALKNEVAWDSFDQNLDYHGYALMIVQNLTAVSHTIIVTGQASATRAARNVRIAAIPLGSLTTYNSSAETETSTTNTAYEDKLSYAPTISATGNHLIFGSSQLTCTKNAAAIKYNNLLIEGIQYQEAIETVADPAATLHYPSFFAVKKLSLTSGTRTFKIQQKSNNVLYTVSTKNARIVVIQIADTTPPASITNLANTTGTTWINWTWINPADADFYYTMVYINGTWQQNTSNPFYNLTGLGAGATRTISTHTVDTSGNINQTWVNQTTTIPSGITIDVTLSNVPVNFSTISAGSSYNPSLLPLNVTIQSTTNVNVNLTLNGSDPISGISSFGVGNISYSNSSTGTKTALAASFPLPPYADWVNILKLVTTNRSIYLWISIPAGQEAGAYSSNLSVRVEEYV